jgi:hypothetical protein
MGPAAKAAEGAQPDASETKDAPEGQLAHAPLP